MLDDERYYQQVLDELREDGAREGLWAKALVQTGGDEHAARLFYIRLRVGQLKGDALARTIQQGKKHLGVIVIAAVGLGSIAVGAVLIAIPFMMPDELEGWVWVVAAGSIVVGFVAAGFGLVAVREARTSWLHRGEGG